MLPQAAQLSQVALRLQGLGERIGIHGEGPGLPLDAELAVLDAPPGSLLDARYKSMGLTKVLDNAGLIVNPSHPLVALLKAHGIDNDINSGHDDGDRACGLALRDLRLWGGRRLDIETLQGRGGGEEQLSGGTRASG